MATPTYPVFDGDGGANLPKRPVAATDLGGLYKVNDIRWEPNPDTQVTAEDVKQWMWCIEAMGRMVPLLRFTILAVSGLSAEHPFQVSCVNSDVTTVSVSVSEVSTGVYTATWSAGMIPTVTGAPTISSYRETATVLVPNISAWTSTSVTFETRDFAGVLSGAETGVVIQVF